MRLTPLLAALLALLATATAAPDFAARLAAADAQFLAGDLAAAGQGYRGLLSDGLAAREPTTEQRFRTATAALSFALCELEAVGRDARDPVIRQQTAELWTELTITVGARILPVIGRGERVRLQDWLDGRRPTLVFFSSEWSPGSVQNLRAMQHLAATQQAVRVLRIEVNRPNVRKVDFDSPTALQFDLDTLPLIRLYRADGTLWAEGDQAVDQVNALIGQSTVP